MNNKQLIEKIKDETFKALENSSHMVDGIRYYCDTPVHVITLEDAMEIMCESLNRMAEEKDKEITKLKAENEKEKKEAGECCNT